MDKILLGHGSGGRLMHQLIREHIAPQFDMHTLADSAVLEGAEFSEGKIAFTTDSYVVSPLFFPGGNIGELAVNGTVNDLAMVGATPLYLSTGFVVEEGFPMESLKRILISMGEAAKKADVKIVAGDTKVVDKGKGDGIFITSSGIGVVPQDIVMGPDMIKPGDKVIISGAIGNHGVAVLSERNGLTFEPPVLSDTAALNGLVRLMLTTEKNIRMMRDPTRGGVATTLKEMATESELPVIIHEDLLTVPDGVRGACELLGLDPLYIANEGILLAIVPAETSEALVSAMKAHPLGAGTSVIGEIGPGDSKRKGMVLLKTLIGGTRIIDMLAGEQLPRIC
ncbi:MAG TPA: hydrogenase expression/formation protein HypE [Dissulfurispiraceae bacterium]|nr:hydrogenase expression/formation protein HypE [Dissulfurispiraceae bacterium]